MPATHDHQLRYPGPDDPPNAPLQVKQLALDVDAAVAAVVPDTGVVTTLDVTATADWSVTVKQHRLLGKKMYLYLRFVYGGAANLTDAGNGNIADTTVANINDVNLRPVMDTFGWYRSTTTGGSAQVLADGRVRVVDLHTGSAIAVGDTLHISMTYPIP